MKILYIVQTYYQLLTVLQLQMTINKDKVAVIVITDHSADADKISLRLSTLTIFHRVFYVKCKEQLHPSSLLGYFSLFLNNYVSNERILGKEVYDYLEQHGFSEINFYNYTLFACVVYKRMYKKNKHLLVNRFEEGYISYYDDAIDSRLVKLIADPILKVMSKNKANYYYFEPSMILYTPTYKIRQIQKISRENKNMKEIIKVLFQIDESFMLDSKFIFFEESYYFEHKKGDLELLEFLHRKLHKQLVIKLHPRDSSNRFKETPYNIMPIIGLPFEAIYFHLNEDVILISVSSGSLISPVLMFDQANPAIFTFPIMKELPPLVNRNYQSFVQKVKSKAKNQLVIIESYEDLNTYLSSTMINKKKEL